MSISTSVMAFSGDLFGDAAEEMANHRVSYGNEAEICRLFQSSGTMSRLLIKAGDERLPFSFLYEGDRKYPGTSDPSWSISPCMVTELHEALKDLDDKWAKQTMRPWGRSYIQEITRAKKAGATAYANSDPKKMYEDEMDDNLMYFNRLKAYIKMAADKGMSLLVCTYEDW